MKPKYIIYDFDGVLVESVSVKDNAFIKIFQEFGNTFAKQMLLFHKKNNTDRFATIKEAASRLKILDTDFILSKASQFAEFVQADVIAASEVKGANLLLSYCKDNGIKQFVSSGAPERELINIVNRRNMSHFFESVRGLPDNKIIHIDYFVEKYNLDTNECLFIGDTMLDYNSAKARNIKFIGRAESLIFPVQCMTVQNMEEFLNILVTDKL